MASCICPSRGDGVAYNQFIGSYFGECLYNEMSVEWMPFILGMVSIVIWAFALFPQIVANYRNKTTEALSPLFLTIWLAGDLFVFSGSLISGERVTMTICAIYFCLNDTMMLFQRWYYSPRSVASRSQKASIALSAFVIIGGGVAGFSAASTLSATGRTLLEGPVQCDASDPSRARFVIGSVVSWIAGVLYFFSRIPQIRHMYTRRSVEGLDVRMFILCILANVSGGLQFIFDAIVQLQKDQFSSGKWCARTLPFVIGSLGTLIFDFIIISMFVLFSATRARVKDVERQ